MNIQVERHFLRTNNRRPWPFLTVLEAFPRKRKQPFAGKIAKIASRLPIWEKSRYANTCAMPLPMVPAPITPTVLISICTPDSSQRSL
jgi:hypothetical protein